MNPAALRARATILRAVRGWFADRGYLEVPTPTLVPSAGLEVHLHPVRADGGFLRTSPEFALKKALRAGLGRVYELGPCFRDDERSPWHRREFTMLEWYRVEATLPDLMDEVESLVEAAFTAVGRPPPGPWRRRSMRELFLTHVGVDLATATAAEISSEDPDDWDGAMLRRFVNDVETRFDGPTFVTDWPASQSALARVVDGPHGAFAQRFEAYIGGVELANAFFELNDASEQRRRHEAANQERRALGLPENPIDEAFVAAVGALPRCAGIALGFDRLVAVAAGLDDVHGW